MVATKAGNNNKRRGNNNAGNKQRFKPVGNKQMASAIFNANQMLDNPGYVDFNEPQQAIPGSVKLMKSPKMNNVNRKGNNSGNSGSPANTNQRRPNMKNGNLGRRPQNSNGNWGPMGPPPPNMFQGPPGPMGHRNGPPPHFRGPMGMRGPMMRGGPPPLMPPLPPLLPPRNNGRFGPNRGPPMRGGRPMPLMPPMGRGPMPHPMSGMGPPLSLMRPRPNVGEGGPMRRNTLNKLNRNNKTKKRPEQREQPQSAPAGGAIKNTNNKNKKPKNFLNQNQYPLDKPWVNDEIKAEHDKKVGLADKLKGNKNDELFAEFKVQRDKFVKMYDAAKLEYIGKHPEQDVDKIMTESGKVKSESKPVVQTVDKKNGETKTNTADTDTNTIES